MLKQLIVISFILLTASDLVAKCGNSILYIDGVVIGAGKNAVVSIEVTPDPNWEPQPPISVDKNGKFRAVVYFDRTKTEGRYRDNCSRKPDHVIVQVHSDGRLVDQAQLTIKHDFVAKDRIDYETRLPLNLHAN